MQALDRVANIKTTRMRRDSSSRSRRDRRFGDGEARLVLLRQRLRGSIAARRNTASIDGDVEWWDFRSWAERDARAGGGRSVSGAVSPWLSTARRCRLECSTPSLLSALAERVAKLVRGRAVYARSLPRDANGQHASPRGPVEATVAHRRCRPELPAGSAVVFVYRGDPALKAPPIGRYRYEVRP